MVQQARPEAISQQGKPDKPVALQRTCSVRAEKWSQRRILFFGQSHQVPEAFVAGVGYCLPCWHLCVLEAIVRAHRLSLSHPLAQLGSHQTL